MSYFLKFILVDGLREMMSIKYFHVLNQYVFALCSQLECNACGNTWYASRDDAATLTIEGPSSVKTVGTAPLATAKFEDVEKNLISPRGVERRANDVLKEAT